MSNFTILHVDAYVPTYLHTVVFKKKIVALQCLFNSSLVANHLLNMLNYLYSSLLT